MILHRLLKSHLLRAGVEDESRPPGPTAWSRLLGALNGLYEAWDEDRHRLTRARAEIRELYADLAAERYKLHSVITSLRLGLCALGADGSVLFMSPEAERMLGWTEEELGSQSVLELLEPTAGGGTALPEAMEDLVGSGRRFTSERYGFRQEGGRLLPVSLSLNPMFRDGALIGAVLVFEPLTGRRDKVQTGEVQEQLSGLAESLDRALSSPLTDEARNRVEAAQDYARSMEVALAGGSEAEDAGVEELAGLRLLVVGSNPAARATLRRQVMAWGVCVVEAGDTSAAVEVLAEAFRRGRPLEAVVVDADLGGTTPEAFEKRLGGDPGLQAVPLLILSGRPGPGRLTTPVKPKELLKALRELSLSSFETDVYPAVRPEVPEVALRPAEYTVLVVEDSPDVAGLVEDCVTDLKQEFVSAIDGEEAWRIYCEEPVHLIVTGWLLPGISGGELCRRVREEARDKDTRLIVLVESDNEESAARERGADACLKAPVEPHHLKQVLLEAFKSKVGSGSQR